MPFETVTPHDVSRARFLLEQVSTALLEADPQMRDDDALFLDMLDGEGADAVDLLRAALRASLDADAQARACKGRMAQLAERQRRHEARKPARGTTRHRTRRHSDPSIPGCPRPAIAQAFRIFGGAPWTQALSPRLRRPARTFGPPARSGPSSA